MGGLIGGLCGECLTGGGFHHNDCSKFDQQAHAMSHPGAQGRQHVSDAAWEAWQKAGNAHQRWRDTCELLHKAAGTVQLTVAEHDALLANDRLVLEWGDKYAELSAERDALRAEVERSGKEYKQAAKFIEAMGLVSTIHPTMQIDVLDPMGMARQIVDYVERLRKGRDDANANVQEAVGGPRGAGKDEAACEGAYVVGETYSHLLQHTKETTLVVVADPLDHRLGLGLPDGEPVEPMSARMPYRWGML